MRISDKTGFTLIAILATLLLPVFWKAREKARQVVCFSNQRQIGMAMLLYAQDYDEAVVPNHTGARVVIRGIDQWHAWYDLIQPYVRDTHHWIFQCPSNPQSRPVGGGLFLSYNKRGCFENLLPGEDSSRLWWGYASQVQEPSETIMVADWGGGRTEGVGARATSTASAPTGTSGRSGWGWRIPSCPARGRITSFWTGTSDG